MAKHTIEVEVPDGWEPVGVGGKLNPGEAVLAADGHASENNCSGVVCYRVATIVLRPVWQYPEWLGGAGVAMDADGTWCLHLRTPTIVGSGRWHCGPGDEALLSFRDRRISKFLPLWSPPHCTDWRESWHPNPRWEG